MLKLQHLLRSSRNGGGIFYRYQSSVTASQKLMETHLCVENFSELTARRQAEALRSVMLEVDSQKVCGQVYHHCKQYGDIKNAFVYSLKDERNLMLIEYENEDAVKETFKFCGFQPNTVNWPNRVLSVRKSKLNPSLSKDAPLQIDNAVEPPVAAILRKAHTFDEQVCLLYEHTRLTDLSVRLKFITALQTQVVINEFLDSIFPNAKVYPFGSSVNGFGKIGCDLDMALRFDKSPKSCDKNNHMPLVFQGKGFENAEEMKKIEGQQVKCVASLIDYFVPGSSAVSAFHGARVPIVRYFDTNIHSSIDLSVNNLDGFQITEFMYAMGLIDARVRPFVFMVRRWAKEFEVTRYTSRDNFTNFQLSYMCLSFLQQLKEPVIPTFEEVMRQIGNSEAKSIEKGAFINFDQFQYKSKNTDTVLELFQQFLEYYESYDFSTLMVTVRTLDRLPKPEPSPLYLENVFDMNNPWGGNVSDAETSTFKIMIRQTLQELEQCATKPTGDNEDWGLLEIISKLK